MFTFEDKASLFFTWRFLPISSAVVLGLLWGIVDADVRRFEPFYQMSREEGATIGESLSLDYISMLGLIVPFVAISRGHVGVAMVSFSYLVTTVVLPMLCDYMWDLEYEDGLWTVNVNATILWLVIGVLVTLVSIMLCVIGILCRRSHGLRRDPGGLAGLAGLLHSSDILPLFRAIPAYETQAFIDDKLQQYRFKLTQSQNDEASNNEPIISATSSPIDGTPEMQSSASALQRPFKQTRGEAHPYNLWGRFLLLPEAVLFGPFIALWAGSYSMAFDDVWSPKVIKALIVFMTTINTMSWAGIEDALRLMEPFRQLATDKPKMSRVDAVLARYEGLNPVSRIFCGSTMVSAVSLAGLLARFFTILAPALLEILWKIAYYHGPRLEHMPKTLKTTADVLRWINLPWGVVYFFIWLTIFSRSAPIVPRKPTTLSSKILYMCRSEKLLNDVHEAILTGENVDEALKAQGQQYRFGWFQADDVTGELQLGVEREPVLLPYSYGRNRVALQSV